MQTVSHALFISRNSGTFGAQYGGTFLGDFCGSRAVTPEESRGKMETEQPSDLGSVKTQESSVETGEFTEVEGRLRWEHTQSVFVFVRMRHAPSIR